MITNLDIYRKHTYKLLYKPIKRLKRLIWNNTFFFSFQLFIQVIAHTDTATHGDA